MFPIHIKIGNETFTLEIEPEYTISKVKKFVKHHTKNNKREIPVYRQRLIFRGVSMADDNTVSQYNIQKDSVIHLLIALPGD